MNSKVKKIVVIGMLVAAQVVAGRFLSISLPIVKIGFAFLPLVIVAMLYGVGRCSRSHWRYSGGSAGRIWVFPADDDFGNPVRCDLRCVFIPQAGGHQACHPLRGL